MASSVKTATRELERLAEMDTAGIAAYLLERGVKGGINTSAFCPLAVYLTGLVGEQVFVLFGTVCGCAKEVFPLPPRVRTFIAQFENGRFPELLDESLSRKAFPLDGNPSLAVISVPEATEVVHEIPLAVVRAPEEITDPVEPPPCRANIPEPEPEPVVVAAVANPVEAPKSPPEKPPSAAPKISQPVRPSRRSCAPRRQIMEEL